MTSILAKYVFILYIIGGFWWHGASATGALQHAGGDPTAWGGGGEDCHKHRLVLAYFASALLEILWGSL